MSRHHRLEQKLIQELNPTYLRVEDESHTHRGPGVESHFKIVAVSNLFQDMTLLARHRLANDWFANEFNSGLHALSLYLYTPKEWQARSKDPQTPICAGKKS